MNSGHHWSHSRLSVEARGQTPGLLEAVNEAAQRDGQLSEGKSLNTREEALLQALEMMTRATQKQEAIWLKACDIRQEVDQLMQDVEDTARSAQWIGHLMNRLQLTDHTAP